MDLTTEQLNRIEHTLRDLDRHVLALTKAIERLREDGIALHPTEL